MLDISLFPAPGPLDPLLPPPPPETGVGDEEDVVREEGDEEREEEGMPGTEMARPALLWSKVESSPTPIGRH